MITYKKSLFSEIGLRKYGQNTFDDLQKGAFWDKRGEKRGGKRGYPPPRGR